MPRCPVCKTRAELVKYEGVPVHNCGTCGGYWVTKAKLNVILARREVVMPDRVKAKMMDIADASDSRQELWCMTCGTALSKEQFKCWPDIELDRCPRCNGIWLDRGELEKCQIYWEYLQDHPESADARLAERLATLEERWATRKAQLKKKLDELQAKTWSHGRAGEVLADLFALDQDLDPGPEV